MKNIRHPMYYHVDINPNGENNTISISKYMLHIIYDPFVVAMFYSELSEEDFNKIYSFYNSHLNKNKV